MGRSLLVESLSLQMLSRNYSGATWWIQSRIMGDCQNELHSRTRILYLVLGHFQTLQFQPAFAFSLAVADGIAVFFHTAVDMTCGI